LAPLKTAKSKKRRFRVSFPRQKEKNRYNGAHDRVEGGDRSAHRRFNAGPLGGEERAPNWTASWQKKSEGTRERDLGWAGEKDYHHPQHEPVRTWGGVGGRETKAGLPKIYHKEG